MVSIKDTRSALSFFFLLLRFTGAIETRTFIDALSDIVTRSGSSARDRNEALKLLEDLVTEVRALASVGYGSFRCARV